MTQPSTPDAVEWLPSTDDEDFNVPQGLELQSDPEDPFEFDLFSSVDPPRDELLLPLEPAQPETPLAPSSPTPGSAVQPWCPMAVQEPVPPPPASDYEYQLWSLFEDLPED
eukprot:m51a1_g2855 hypothetical protein (111) ;mRNA; r:327962-328294